MVLLLFCTGCSSSETENSQEDVNEPPVVEVTDFTEHGKFSDPTPEPEPPAGAEIEDGEPLPLDGRLICIDPGHCVTPLTGKGYTDLVSPLSTETKPLYTAGTTGKNMTEEQLNLTVGLKLRDYLEELGAEVIMPVKCLKLLLRVKNAVVFPIRQVRMCVSEFTQTDLPAHLRMAYLF